MTLIHEWGFHIQESKIINAQPAAVASYSTGDVRCHGLSQTRPSCVFAIIFLCDLPIKTDFNDVRVMSWYSCSTVLKFTHGSVEPKPVLSVFK